MRKTTLTCIATVLLGTTLFASCAGTSSKVTFSTYWQKDVMSAEQASEELVYEVSHEKGTPLNNYTLEYETGTYTTTLTTKTENGVLLYEYTTQFSISGTFAFGENTHAFTDYVRSNVIFQSAANALTPISSTKEYSSHTPRNTQATAETDFSTWKEAGVVTIDHVAKKATVERTAGTKTGSRTSDIFLKKEKYSYLDNEQLLLALRGVHQAANSTPYFHVYAPFTRSVQTVKATFGTKTTEENMSFLLNGAEFTDNVSYFPVTLVLDEKNEGASQTLWIAAANDVRNNTLRNVVLKNVVQVAYGHGTLTYQLKSATFNV